MSVPPSNQDGSFPDRIPDFLAPSGYEEAYPGADSAAASNQQYGQSGQYPPYHAGLAPGQPSYPSPQTPQDPYYPPAQPYAPYVSAGQPPNPYQVLPKPTTWSWAKKVGVAWLAIFVVVAVFFAGRALWPSSQPTGTNTSTPPGSNTSPSPTGGPHTPGPELPIVLEPAPVVAAIDLPAQPTLGEGWSASDGHPGEEGMIAATILTPCGVLVTFLTPDYDRRVESGKAPLEADQSRIVGYEIATGTRLWTVDFQDATGQRDPELTWESPTYTPACQMVFMSRDRAYEESVRDNVGIVIDLVAGSAGSYYSEYLYNCEAASNDWAACWTLDEVFLVSLSDFKKSPQSTAQLRYRDGTEEYLKTGGLVVSGYLWTPEGYRDLSGDIVFGQDTHAGAVSGDSRDPNWVMYVEPLRPGAYRSGLVLRVEGSLFLGHSMCQAMLWDPSNDTALWDAPGEFPCGEDSWGGFSFTATQSVLVITTPGDEALHNAFALSDGHFIWTQEGLLLSGGTAFQNVRDSMSSMTNDYVFFAIPRTYEYVTRRVWDGADATSFDNLLTFSTSMAYTSEYCSRYKYCFSSYSLDTADPTAAPKAAWSIPVSEDWPMWHTFATNGTMYLVIEDTDTGELIVRPFVV